MHWLDHHTCSFCETGSLELAPSRARLSVVHCSPADRCIPPEGRHLLPFRRHDSSHMATLPSTSFLRSCFHSLSHLCPRLDRPLFAASIPRPTITQPDSRPGFSAATSLPSDISTKGHQHAPLDCLHHSTHLLREHRAPFIGISPYALQTQGQPASLPPA